MILFLSTLALAASPSLHSDLECAQLKAGLTEHECDDRMEWTSDSAHAQCVAERADIVSELKTCSGTAVTGQERDALLSLQTSATTRTVGKVMVIVVGTAVCTTNEASDRICTAKVGQGVVVAPGINSYATPDEEVTEQIRRLSL